MNKLFNAKFSSSEWDDFLAQWLEGGLDPALLQEWSHVLMFDNHFREEFCDFIKSLREPSWKSSPSKGEAH